MLILLFLAGCNHIIDWPDPQDPGELVPIRDDLSLATVATGFDAPVLVLPWPTDPDRLLVVEQPGRVRFIDGNGPGQTYLDISDRVGTCHFEQGMLGMAFSPDFATDGRFYVTYTDKPCEKVPFIKEHKGDLHVARFTTDPSATSVDASMESTVLEITQPFRNHNGGNLLFGVDGMLYVSVGDGGDGGDPNGNGQNRDTVLGSILRIDVGGDSYTIPADNPFADGKAPEVYVYGLRNPWRFTFDNATGDMWIADVGEARFEEVNHLPAGQISGANLGWNRFEGNERHKGRSDGEGMVFPVAQYEHEEGRCSVSGGPFLRNTTLPGLDARYLFADWCSGRLWAIGGPDEYPLEALMDTGLQVTGFGRGAAGEVYLLHWAGSVHELVAVEAVGDTETTDPADPDATDSAQRSACAARPCHVK